MNMLLRLRALKVSAFTVIALVVVLGAEASQVLAESFLAAEETKMLSMVNQHRTSRGLSALKSNDALKMIARRHTRDMTTKGELYHNPDLKAEMNASLPGWKYSGENVGVGPSTDAVQEAFIESAPHRQNIETGRFNIVGIGAMARDDGRMYFTQNFADYAKSAPKPAAPAPTAAPKAPAPAPVQRVVTAAPQPEPVRPAAVPLPPTSTPEPEKVEPTPAVLGSTDEEPQPAPAPKDPGFWDVLLAMLEALVGKVAFWR